MIYSIDSKTITMRANMNVSSKIFKIRQTLDPILPYLDTGMICSYSFFLSRKVKTTRGVKIKEIISLNLDSIFQHKYMNG